MRRASPNQHSCGTAAYHRGQTADTVVKLGTIKTTVRRLYFPGMGAGNTYSCPASVILR